MDSVDAGLEFSRFTYTKKREVDGLVEELAAVYDKDTIRAIYEFAVNDQPYSFLNVKLDAADKKDMFWLRWESRIIPEDIDIEESDAEPLHDSSRAPQRVREPRSRPSKRLGRAQPQAV